MRRMLSEEQLKKKILQYAPSGAVNSVNGKTGVVVLKDNDIHISTDLTNTKTIHSELERIDGEVEDCIDDIAALETAITGKQNTLTAGTNITIVNDVISATQNTLHCHQIQLSYRSAYTQAGHTMMISVFNNSAALFTLATLRQYLIDNPYGYNLIVIPQLEKSSSEYYTFERVLATSSTFKLSFINFAKTTPVIYSDVTSVTDTLLF